MKRRHILTAFGASALVLSTMSVALADWEPRRPVTAIVPYGAGGGTDTIARALTTALADELPVPVVVANKPGSSGIIGATQVANGASDGTNILITSAGSFVLNSLMREVEVDPFDDFVTVAQIGDLTTSLMVPANSEIQSVEDLVAAAKAAPGTLRWSHTGKGSFHHIAGSAFLQTLDIEAVDVPFKGGSNTRAAVMGNQVDFGMIGVQQLTGFEAELRPLAIVADERDAAATDVPTFAELGFDVPVITSPIMVMMPKDTSAEVVEAFEAAIAAATAADGFAERMEANGVAPAYLDSAAATANLEALRDAAAPVIADLK